MHPQNKTFILILLLLFICSFSGRADGFKDDVDLIYPRDEVIIQMKARKLIGVDAMVDYQHPGPNPAHEPGKGTPPSGKGGNNT